MLAGKRYIDDRIAWDYLISAVWIFSTSLEPPEGEMIRETIRDVFFICYVEITDFNRANAVYSFLFSASFLQSFAYVLSHRYKYGCCYEN